VIPHIVAVLLLSQSVSPESLTDADRIFDGSTMTGWRKIGGGTWTIAKEVLKGECKKEDEQGVLVHEEPVGDFVARLEFRIASGNSGFYFRTEAVDGQPLVKGFQAEIDATPAVGGIWETGGRGWVAHPTSEVHAKTKYRAGEWTDLQVTAIGDRYVVKVNGATVVDISDPAGRKKGLVAVQLHGGMDMTVELRNIRLRRLSSAGLGFAL